MDSQTPAQDLLELMLSIKGINRDAGYNISLILKVVDDWQKRLIEGRTSIWTDDWGEYENKNE